MLHLRHAEIQKDDLELRGSSLFKDVQALLAGIQHCRFTSNRVEQPPCDNSIDRVVIHNHDLTQM